MKKQRMRRELAAEVEAHISERADELMDKGISETQAHQQARREFGNPTLYTETGGETWGWLWLERLGKDVRYAMRALRRSPLFTATAVLSLALGIGANTAIFTLLYASLWRPLPIPEPNRVFQIRRHAADGPWTGESGSSYVLFREFNSAAGDRGEVFAKGRSGPVRFGAQGVSNERINGEAVSANFFTALRVRPYLGRVFEPQDDSLAGGRRVAILSHTFWSRRFQADPSVLGRTILYGETPYTIVGVSQPGFTGVDAEAIVDAWVPVTTSVQAAWLTDPNVNWLQSLIRLNPGVSREPVQALFETTFRVHVKDKLLPDTPPHWRPMLEAQHITLRSAVAGLATTGHRYEKPLLLLMMVVGLVLLISCGNVANLSLARNSSRQHEISIRAALGASRGRVVRQLFTESMLLAAAGAACGLVLAALGTQLLVSFLPKTTVPLAFDLRPGFAVLGFTAAVAIVTAVLFGLIPAWRAGRGGETGLRSAVRVTRNSFGGRLLVAGQLALSLILLVAAGLFAATLRNLNATDLGFRPDNLVAFEVSFPKDAAGERIHQNYTQIKERLESHAGVMVSYAWPSLYSRGGWSGGIEVEGRPNAPGEDNEVGLINAGPGLFDVTGMRLLQGRYLKAQDQSDKPPVALVNESFARYYFGSGQAIGKRIKASGTVMREIVGVVRDVRHFGVREKVWRMVYLPTWSSQGGTFFVRGPESSNALSGTIRADVLAVDKTAQIETIRPVTADVNDMISQERLTATLCTILGALALLLAAVGLYGVVAYSVSRRTSEFGIRMALGARRVDVQRLVLGQTAALVAVGIAGGLVLAVALVRVVSNVLAGMLYEVKPTDSIIFGAAAMLLGIIALLAAALPARRASRIDPTNALRFE